MLNRLYNGEMQAKNPAGLPGRNPERMIPRAGVPEQDWWLRNVDRSRHRTDGAYTYYSEDSLKKKNFQVGSLGSDHSRRVFSELARQGHSFSEANLQAIRENGEIRKEMQKRYSEVMSAPTGPPGPTKSFFRSSSQPASSSKGKPLTPVCEQNGEDSRAPKSASEKSGQVVDSLPRMAMSQTGGFSMVSGAASAVAASRVSINRPDGSKVSQSAPSFLPRMAPQRGGSVVASATGSIEAPRSAVEASALSVSDFYAWRPRLLR